MKKWKALLLLSVTGLLTFKTPVTSEAAWATTDAGKIYTQTADPGYVTGMKKIGSYWYYFNDSGIMQTGVQTVGDKKYYFNPSTGRRSTGWKTVGTNGDSYYFRTTNGVMVTGFKELKNKLYYFNENGILQKGWILLPEKSYYADENGVIARSKWIGNCYFLDDGSMAVNQWIDGKWVGADGKYAGIQNTVGWVTENGNTYYYNNSRQPVKGWLNADGNTYYMNPTTGALMKGWLKIGGETYYASSKKGIIQKSKWIQSKYLTRTGAMATGMITVGSKKYLLDSNGCKLTGWQKYAGAYYYFNSSGVMQKSKWIDNYYVTSTGKRASGITTIGKYTYCFDVSTGQKKTGWITEDGQTYWFSKYGILQKKRWLWGGKYYATSSGAILKGLNKVGSSLYFFDDTTGEKLTHSTKTIQGNKYYFKKNGKAACKTWVKIKSKYYYFKSDGTMARNTWVGKYYVGPDGARTTQTKQTGWSTVDGIKYYFDSNGNMVTGFLTLSGNTYYFNSAGAMQTGLQTIGTQKYYFFPDGRMATSITIKIGTKEYTTNASGVVTSEKSIKITENSTGAQIVNFALQYVGNPYVYGGVSLTNGADCSGFVQTVFSNFNIKLLRVANDQMYGPTSSQIKNQGYKKAVVVDMSSIQPGDLLFYGSVDSSTGKAYASHVAIYMGNGEIVHASNSQPYPAGGIKVSNYDYNTPIMAIRYW